MATWEKGVRRQTGALRTVTKPLMVFSFASDTLVMPWGGVGVALECRLAAPMHSSRAGVRWSVLCERALFINMEGQKHRGGKHAEDSRSRAAGFVRAREACASRKRLMIAT